MKRLEVMQALICDATPWHVDSTCTMYEHHVMAEVSGASMHVKNRGTFCEKAYDSKPLIKNHTSSIFSFVFELYFGAKVLWPPPPPRRLILSEIAGCTRLIVDKEAADEDWAVRLRTASNALQADANIVMCVFLA
jgi:hypothetical protein